MAKRVLVIDDDIDVLEVIESILTYESFEVISISKTNDIIKTIEEYHPDIVLLDFVLGKLSGGELCKQIKSNFNTQHLPVIIISAYKKDLEALDAFDCDHFIPKPFSLVELIDGINKTLGDQ